MTSFIPEAYEILIDMLLYILSYKINNSYSLVEIMHGDLYMHVHEDINIFYDQDNIISK